MGVDTVNPVADGDTIGEIGIGRREEGHEIGAALAGRMDRQKNITDRAVQVHDFAAFQVYIDGDPGFRSIDRTQRNQATDVSLLYPDHNAGIAVKDRPAADQAVTVRTVQPADHQDLLGLNALLYRIRYYQHPSFIETFHTFQY